MELLEQCAREKAGMGADWKPWAFECLPHHPLPTELVQVTGAVVPLKTRGKHAGRPDWNKKDKSTIRTVYITLKDHAEWVKEWERKTGLCANCEGSGEEWAGWSAAEGSKKRPCAKCGATGKSNEAPSATREAGLLQELVLPRSGRPDRRNLKGPHSPAERGNVPALAQSGGGKTSTKESNS